MKVHFISIVLIFCNTIMYGGDPFFLTTDVNKDLPNAEYAYSFLQITDIHVGEGEGDYGSPGFMNDTAPTDIGGWSAERLLKSVLWINDHHIEKNIKFVIVSGDITDSGERSEFDKAKSILDRLEIPYVPLLGNHDAWPYVRYQEEAWSANGDSVMNVVFEDTFDTLSNFFSNYNDTARKQATYNPESRKSHYFNNFWYEYDGDYYVFLDFNPRVHVFVQEPGISAAAHLMDFDGGTFPWLINTLATLPSRGRDVFITSHHPVSKDFFTIVNGFDPIENDKLSRGVFPYRNRIVLWMSGHIHRYEDYIFSTYDGYNICKVVETDANKEWKDGQFRIVNVYHSPSLPTALQEDVSALWKVYPVPSKEYICIESPKSGKFFISVVDADGKLLTEKTVNLIKDVPYSFLLEDLCYGNYYIHIQGDDYTVSKEFIKVR